MHFEIKNIFILFYLFFAQIENDFVSFERFLRTFQCSIEFTQFMTFNKHLLVL